MTLSSSQKVIALEHGGTFPFDGRGPILHRWLWFEDLLLPDSSAGYHTMPKRRVGGQSEHGWVLFHGVQVVQPVPEEVHSYWHHPLTQERGAAWRVESSNWLASFSQRHLAECEHYVLEFYDYVVEVICEEVSFGPGAFDLATVLPNEPRLRYAYMRRAISLKKMGRFAEAIAGYDRYIATGPKQGSLRDAEFNRSFLLALLALTPILEDVSLTLEAKVASIIDKLPSLGWEAIRTTLLHVLYDDARESEWRACLEAHLQLLNAERLAAGDSNLMALAVHRLGEGDETVARFADKLGLDLDPITDPRVARALERLRKP